MNSPRLSFRLGFTAATLLGLLAAGCSTPAHQQAAQTSGTLTNAADDIETARRNLNSATIALDRLLNQPATDLRPAFTDYRGAVDSLDRSMARVHDRAQEMADRRQSYIATWDRENAAISDPAVRARSVARQQEVANQLLQAERSYLDVREDMTPLLAGLRDVQRLLSVDLTPAGVENARSLFGQVERNAERTRRSLDRLAQDFREASVHVNPSTTVIAE